MNTQNFYLERQGTFQIKNKSKNIRLDDRGSVITFGRERFANVILYNKRCNSHHCEIILDENGRIFIKDLGGSSGTYVNTEKIRNTQKELFVNDLIGMGFNPYNADHLANKVAYIFKVKQFETITLDSDSDESDVEIIEEQVVPQNINEDSKSNDEEFDKDEEDVEESEKQIFDFPSISRNNEANLSESSEKSKDLNEDTTACEDVVNKLWCSNRRQSILMLQNFQVHEENYQELRENEEQNSKNNETEKPKNHEESQQSRLMVENLENNEKGQELTQNLSQDQSKSQNPVMNSSKNNSAIDEESQNLMKESPNILELENVNSNSETKSHQFKNSLSSPACITPQKIKEKETALRHCNVQTTKFIENLPETNSDESLLIPLPTPPQKPKRGRKKKKIHDADIDQPCKRTVQTTKALKSFKPKEEITENDQIPSVSSKRKQSQQDLNQNENENSSKMIKTSSIQTRRKSILKCSGLESSTDQNSKSSEPLNKRRKSVTFDLPPNTSGYKPKINTATVVQPQKTITPTPNDRSTQDSTNFEFPSTSLSIEPQPSTSSFDSTQNCLPSTSKLPPRRISLFNNQPLNLNFPSRRPSTLNVEPQPSTSTGQTSNPVLLRRKSIFEEKQIYSNLGFKEREQTLKHWKKPTTKLIDEPIPIGRMKKSQKPVVTKVPAKRGRKKIEPQVEQTEEQKKVERMKEMLRETPKRKRGPNKKKGNDAGKFQFRP